MIDDAIFPSWPVAGYESWAEALAPIRPLLIVLLPDFAGIVQRNERRTRVFSAAPSIRGSKRARRAGWSGTSAV